MPTHRDPLRLAIRLVVYIVLGFLSLSLLGWAFLDLGAVLGAVATVLSTAFLVNWISLRIYEHLNLRDLGLHWNRASSHNLALGIMAGAAAACLVLAPPLLLGLAHMVATPAEQPSWGAMVFTFAMLAAGAVGEELLFRGYGFQILLAAIGPYATILPVGVLFALLHGNNPNATWFGLANTAAFGIVFGYAYLRSRDLWLPIGLHFGWNFTLPLFGVNLSGLRMDVTGHEMAWRAGPLWSGGAYGPEASLLTSGGRGAAVRLFLEGAGAAAVFAHFGSARGACRMRAFATLAVLSLLAGGWIASRAADKLTEEDKIELVRGLMAEYGKAKVLVPALQKGARTRNQRQLRQEGSGPSSPTPTAPPPAPATWSRSPK